MSPLAWGRGLKHCTLVLRRYGLASPLAWGRGLKPIVTAYRFALCVAPRVGAWIETEFEDFAIPEFDRSPLAWGRGLKLKLLPFNGSVSEVAPRVGAWIETNRLSDYAKNLRRRPSRGGVD